MMSPECQTHYAPASTGLPSPLDNTHFAEHMTNMGKVWARFSVHADEISVNEEKKQVTMWAHSDVEVKPGLRDESFKDAEWRGEYMYLLSFDENGDKLVRIVEFMDSLRTEELKDMFFKALAKLS